jgi:hypothetical protein
MQTRPLLPRLAGAFLCLKESVRYPADNQKKAKRALNRRFDCFLVGTFFIIGIYYAAHLGDTHP